MLATCPRVLHFEDNQIQQALVKERLKKTFDHCKIKSISSLLCAEPLLNKFTPQFYDVIICDYYFPKKDASSILSNLADCGLTVIFYSCIDEIDFCENCMKILGEVPYNFKFVKKGSVNNLQTIVSLIQNELH
jgi:CheY-like chemotaxis protein